MHDPLLKKIKDKEKAKVSNNDAIGAESVLNCLSQWAKEKEGEEALNVAVVGVANVRLPTEFLAFSLILFH
jgi:nuclear GTP-binding protein